MVVAHAPQGFLDLHKHSHGDAYAWLASLPPERAEPDLMAPSHLYAEDSCKTRSDGVLACAPRVGLRVLPRLQVKVQRGSQATQTTSASPGPPVPDMSASPARELTGALKLVGGGLTF